VYQREIVDAKDNLLENKAMFTLVTSYPMGYSDLLPEGICGLLDTGSYAGNSLSSSFKRKKSKKEGKVKVKVKAKVTKDKEPSVAKVNKVATKVAKKAKSIADKYIGAISYFAGQEHPDEKKVARQATPVPQIMSFFAGQEAPKVPKSKRKLKTERSQNIPKKAKRGGMEIDFEHLKQPDIMEKLDLDNIIEVEEELLQKVSKITEIRTRKLSKKLLLSITPSILAYSASVGYVGAVMSDSFGIDLEEDKSLTEAIKDITKLEVLAFFVDKLKIPLKFKENLLGNLIDKLTTKTVDRMEVKLKQTTAEDSVKKLEAVLAKGSTKETAVIRQKSRDEIEGEHMIKRPMLKPRSSG
jgi:hypothetical protein